MSNSVLPSPYPLPGEIIGDSWRIEKILGEGGMGAVARAWDLILHTPVAIKFMNPQFLTFPGAEERFINEGKASALIKSDHVVPVMKAGKTAEGTPYLVMECLEGVDLADLILRDGNPGLPVERAVHFILQVLRALQAAHAIGIIHRDMKPSNCFAVTKDGEEDFVKILDFGISKIQKPGSASLTQTNSALGTPLYMSPEQARSPRDVDARSDLYSVGVILYELLTGHTPFFSESGEFTEILFKLFTAEPPPVQTSRSDIPDALAAAVHKALARDVEQRFITALQMAEALAPYASERSRHVLTRMRAFKAPATGSIMPPEDLPQSMVAFSQLQHGQQTEHMVNRPAADVVRGPPVTEMLPRPLIGGVGVAPPRLLENDAGGTAGASDNRIAAAPAAPGTRARADEAGARTQLDEAHHGSDRAAPAAPATTGMALPPGRPITGASTDLSNARDASLMADKERKTRSPLIYALPIVALVAGAGAVFGLARSRSGDATPRGPASAVTAETLLPTAPTSLATTAPPTATATATATAAAATASALPFASTVASASAARPPVPNAPPNGAANGPRPHASPPPHHPGRPNVLETDIKQ